MKWRFTVDLIEIKMVIRECCKHLCINKLDNLDEMINYSKHTNYQN